MSEGAEFVRGVGGSPYLVLQKKNERLAKFTNDNPEIAKLFMAIITHIEQVSREKGRLLDSLDYKSSPDGLNILIKVNLA